MLKSTKESNRRKSNSKQTRWKSKGKDIVPYITQDIPFKILTLITIENRKQLSWGYVKVKKGSLKSHIMLISII